MANAKKVFIGVGHGGSDPGAVANGFRESDLNLAIALSCQSELARHGVLTKISRTKDENDTLTEEIEECNAFDPDLAVDIHNNSGGGDGAEVFHTIKGGVGKTLAVNILDEIVKIGQNSRGAKTRKNSSGHDYYGFIRLVFAPSVIVEGVFIDNRNDLQAVDTKEEQAAFGVAIAKGILKTLGIAYKEPEAAAKPSKVTEVTAKDSARNFLKSLAGTYKVTASALNVRHGAGSLKKKMITIPKGTAVKCYGFYTAVLGVKWLYIQFTYKGVKYTGFAHSKYLKK